MTPVEMILLGLIILIGVVIAVDFLFFRPYGKGGEVMVRYAAVLFSLWVVSTAVFGSRFLVARIPGVFDLNLERICFLLMMVVLVKDWLKGDGRQQRTAIIEVFALIFAFICIVSMIQHGFKSSSPQFTSPWNAFINGYLFPMLGFVYAKCYLYDTRDYTLFFYVLFYFGVYLSIMSFFEYFGLRQFVFPGYISDPNIWLHLDRARGPFLNAALNGFALSVGYISGIHLLSKKTGVAGLFHVALLSLFFPAIFCTQTRSSYLIFLIMNICLMAFYHAGFPKWKVLALPLIMVLAFAVLNLPRLASSERREGGVMQVEEVDLRYALIRRSIMMFFDNPIFGVGLAQFVPKSYSEYRGRAPVPESSEEQIQHNHLMGMMVELGIVGVIVYVTIVLLFLSRVRDLAIAARMTKDKAVEWNTVLVIFLGGLSFLVLGLFLEPSYSLFANSVFFAFIGLSDGIYNHIG